jgi:hypothetical protein
VSIGVLLQLQLPTNDFLRGRLLTFSCYLPTPDCQRNLPRRDRALPIKPHTSLTYLPPPLPFNALAGVLRVKPNEKINRISGLDGIARLTDRTAKNTHEERLLRAVHPTASRKRPHTQTVRQPTD